LATGPRFGKLLNANEAQTDLTISLLAQPNAVQDSIDRHLDRAGQLTSSQPEKALAAAKTALTLAKKNHLILSEAKAYQRLSRIYAERDDYVRALGAAKTGLAIFHKLGEQRDVCRMYMAVGVINRYLKLYDASIGANLQALTIAEARQDTALLGAIYGNLGNVYFDQKDYDRSLQSGLKALNIQMARQASQAVGNTFHNLARIYRIRRVVHLCAQLVNQRWQVADWYELIYQYGYYDQSHFIREFTQFLGKRPTLYIKDNRELARYLS
jgi:tetratricopeptide (TPR) repeat protein